MLSQFPSLINLINHVHILSPMKKCILCSELILSESGGIWCGIPELCGGDVSSFVLVGFFLHGLNHRIVSDRSYRQGIGSVVQREG
jgi:hypothetical protein